MSESTLKSDLIQIIQEARVAILDVYDSPFDVDRKTDDTPITEADRRAHDVIVSRLSRLDSKIPIVSEESNLAAYEERRTWDQYWLVDPLDGTKEFVKRNGEFTVNVALVIGHESKVGAVGRPTSNTVYYGDVKAQNAVKITGEDEFQIDTRAIQRDMVRSVQSRRRADPRAERFLSDLESDVGAIARDFRGSSLKFLALAAGEADLYIQPGGTSEWDTAAAQAVLQAAGGCVMTLQGESLRYNTRDSVLNVPFIAIGDSSTAWRATLLRHLAIFSE
ncbi:MAG: 3'(2'),5'-bisphosphate nucleotidase CysQ [Pseudomonadales bacterium]|nr:3'(2'),5'-bisphosphate nucleotidase CysQ [Pseudomonadales bacterium]